LGGKGTPQEGANKLNNYWSKQFKKRKVSLRTRLSAKGGRSLHGLRSRTAKSPKKGEAQGTGPGAN